MSTKLFNAFAAAAMSVLALACAKEPVTGDGQTVEATFDVDVPGVEVSTKGLSDAASVNELICQVFLDDGNYTPVPDLNQTVEVKDKKAKVTFNLVKGQTYAFIFWAQTKGTGYYNTEDLRSVKMNVDAVKANDPAMDAFWATETKKTARINQSSPKTLYRALAQVNFGQVGLDRQDKLTVKESLVKAKGVPDTFHPFLGGTSNACEGSVDITFAKNTAIADEKLTVSNVDYDYLATAYVFAPNSKTILSDVSATFTFDNGKETTVSAPNAPLRGKFRTNVLGNLLTVGLEWNVSVDPQWGGDDIYDVVSANLTKGATVTLTENYNIGKSNYSGLVIPMGTESVLNLNGYTISNENTSNSNKAALDVRGTLTINGEGTVYSKGANTNSEYKEKLCDNAVVVEQGGHLVINGGIYNVGKDKDGKCNSTIYVDIDNYGRSGSVEINGGVFMNEEGSNGHAFVLNQNDKITVNCFSVKGGIFVGFNPASVNEAHGAITSFVADGYKSVETTYDGKQAWEVVAIPAVGTQDEFNAALNDVNAGESATICLGSGEFTTYGKTIAQGKTLEFIGKGAETSTYVCGHDLTKSGEYRADYSLENSDVVFSNLKLDVGTADYLGFIRPKSLTFKNCVIDGRLSYMGVGKVVFTDCTFNQTNADYNLWTYSGNEFVFENCKFNSVGKFLNLYKDGGQIEYKVTIKNCTFNSSTVNKSALELKKNADKTYEVYFEGKNTCTNIRESTLTGSMLYNSNEGETDSVVYVDGKKVWEKGAKVTE